MSPAQQLRQSATDIAIGLIRTGRAEHPQRVGNILRLERKAGGYFWISFDGRELRKGLTLVDAEELQDNFRVAMALVGRHRIKG